MLRKIQVILESCRNPGGGYNVLPIVGDIDMEGSMQNAGVF